LSSSFESLICLIQPVDIIQALILFHKKEGDGRDWDKCRTNEKARREASLSEKVFFRTGNLLLLKFFLIVFFGGQETDSKWRTRIGRPSDPQNNQLNLFG